MASKIEVVKVLAVLAAAWPNYEIKDGTADVYARALADIPGEVLDAAAIDHISRGVRFFPAASELRDAAFGILENRLGIPCAAEAWGEVSGGMRDAPPTRCPSFSHPVIRRVVNACGGWYTLCTSDNATADRARFLEAFEQITARDREQRRMLPEVRQLAQRLQDERAALGSGERLRLADGQN